MGNVETPRFGGPARSSTHEGSNQCKGNSKRIGNKSYFKGETIIARESLEKFDRGLSFLYRGGKEMLAKKREGQRGRGKWIGPLGGLS